MEFNLHSILQVTYSFFLLLCPVTDAVYDIFYLLQYELWFIFIISICLIRNAPCSLISEFSWSSMNFFITSLSYFIRSHYFIPLSLVARALPFSFFQFPWFSIVFEDMGFHFTFELADISECFIFNLDLIVWDYWKNVFCVPEGSTIAQVCGFSYQRWLLGVLAAVGGRYQPCVDLILKSQSRQQEVLPF